MERFFSFFFLLILLNHVTALVLLSRLGGEQGQGWGRNWPGSVWPKLLGPQTLHFLWAHSYSVVLSSPKRPSVAPSFLPAS